MAARPPGRSVRPPRWRRLAAIAIGCAVACGCASRAGRIDDARAAYYSGRLESARDLYTDLGSPVSSGEEVVLLDRAMIALAAGRPAEAESLLRSVRDRWRHAEQGGVAQKAVTLVTDEATSAYHGDDLERVLLTPLLAMTNLMHDGGDAAAYCEQFHREQERLLQARHPTPDNEPEPGGAAVGAYLRGALKEATHRDYDAAERAYVTVAKWQPDYLPAQQDIRRVSTGVHSSPGHGVVYVWTLVNPGPRKVEQAAEATSAALLIAGELVSALGDHSLPPTIAPVKIAATVAPPPVIESVAVSAGGAPLGATQTITDVARLAVAESIASRDQRIAEAVARRVVKKAAVYAAKDALAVSTGLPDFALSAAGVLWEASERADTRCWSLLPGQFQVLRVELPAGQHELSLQPTRGGVAAGPPETVTVEVIDGANSYVLGCYPQGALVGGLLVKN